MTATAAPAPDEQAERPHSPYRNAAVVIAITITMVSLFAISYSLAPGRRRHTTSRVRSSARPGRTRG